MLHRIALSWLWLTLLGGVHATETSPSRPNFLVIISDDQRPDTIAALGNRWINTPALDQLVRTGTSFTRAICSNPHCVPSRAEILTGTTGFRNGVLHANGRFRSGGVFWAETLRQAGYRTWYSGKWMNDGSPKTRGYEHTRALFSSGGGGARTNSFPTDHKGAPVSGYSGWTFKRDDGNPEPDKGIGLTPDINRLIAEGAIAALRENDSRPFFLHVNFTAPHDPLLIPPGGSHRLSTLQIPPPANWLPEHPFDHGNLRGRDEMLLPFPRTPAAISRELAAYYVVIEEMDRQIGRILETLEAQGRHENTVVIFSSDHGLALGSHGLAGKQNQYEHTIGVPLIFRGPGILADHRQSTPCALRDLFPTSCELAGITVPGAVTGRSLAPHLKGTPPDHSGFSFGYWQDCQRMIRSERFKLIAYPKVNRWQWFDLKADPEERNDLTARAAEWTTEQRGEFTALRARLERWLQAESDPDVETVSRMAAP